MNGTDLAEIGAAFADEALGSQAVFRSALEAMSHPGRIVPVVHDAQPPGAGHAAAGGLLLAVLDADCQLWLSPSLAASAVGAWLRFHTGCRLVQDHALAHFAWVALGDTMPDLGTFEQGSDDYPDRAATVVVDVAEVDNRADAGAWTLRGPGIRDAIALRAKGLSGEFARQWALNHRSFPRGVDVFIATREAIVGLPRTTRVTIPAEP